MSSPYNAILAAATALSRNQIRQAGQRYTPGVDPQAPNLRIKSLFAAIENLACGEAALARFQSVLDAFSDSWTLAKHSSQRRDEIQTLTEDARASISSIIDRLRKRDAGAADEWLERLSNLEASLRADIEHWRKEESKLPPEKGEGGYSSARENIRGNMAAIWRCLGVVRDEQGYVHSDEFKVLFDPQLLISGEWGTGKTHLLCDATQARLARGLPTVLVLAKNFQGQVVSDICGRIDAALTEVAVFERLQTLANEVGERALVIVDGVNEGRRRDWREAVTKLRSLIALHPGIGLIVTCRTPFESIAIEQGDVEKFRHVTHLGFDDQEFDAQAAFFQYYSLPLPEVPLLDREFSRPLTLKLICQSLQNLTGKKLAHGFAGIASGQRGMTYVLESFANRVGETIEREFGLKNKGCWLLLKGDDQISDGHLAGFAPCMAKKLRGFVFPSEADRIVAANYPSLKPVQRRRLLEALRTSGLVEEDAIWYSGKAGIKSRIVFRLPYQRFSDHLIARHLLQTHLDVSSVDTIRQSFAVKSPLGRLFRVASRYQREYAEPGWAQALITEFPARVRKHLTSKQRELFFVLPDLAQDLEAYLEPFIEGLFWRDPETFTEGTHVIINRYLSGGSREWDRVVDALAAVSTKPKHPYHARRLYDFLASYPMPDRDLQWSEYLRQRDTSPTIQRLLTWAKKLDATKMTASVAVELVTLLSLVLTTVDRSDRDVATKALVLIGERLPDTLFAHTVKSLEFNDPYVPERMLAAAYGVTLSLVDSAEPEPFRSALGTLAKTLYEKMFARGARHATSHTLIRDYALGIIETARRAGCVALPKAADLDLAPPFPNVPSTFADGGPDTAFVGEAIGHAIRMDFGNYTIGRLIPNRANYDDKHPDYLQVRAKIERRMFDLGYRDERFKEVDREISNASWNADDKVKVDRYGKKYSWIAYFEMWGEREAVRRLPDWRLGERTSDCGVDPSFPKRPPTWKPPIPDLFGRPDRDTEAWVGGTFTPNWNSLLVVPEINGHHGDWALLDGFVSGTDEGTDRELFAFLRGLFVARVDVESFRSKFLALEYPGNSAIPEGASEHYLFAGEAGRRQNYARQLLRHDGRYRRQTAEAFHDYVPVGPAPATRATTVKIKVVSPDGKPASTSSFEFLRSVPKMRRIPGVRVEIPSVAFSWESYHSSQNDFSGFDLPAPALIQRLGLASRNREVDFYDADGKPATLYREAGDAWKGDRHKLLYLRADLLRRYLADTRQVLVWCNWGEREWMNKMKDNEVIRDATRQRIWQAHRHIHRSFSQWSAKRSTIE